MQKSQSNKLLASFLRQITSAGYFLTGFVDFWEKKGEIKDRMEWFSCQELK